MSLAVLDDAADAFSGPNEVLWGINVASGLIGTAAAGLGFGSNRLLTAAGVAIAVSAFAIAYLAAGRLDENEVSR